MKIVIHYVNSQGVILVQEFPEYPKGHASEQELQKFAKDYLQSLDLSQRCVSAIKVGNIYTLATTAKFE